MKPRWPVFVSVPHGGRVIPDWLVDRCRLSVAQIVDDGDEGAMAIYAGLEERATGFLAADVARCVVDLNRPEDDLGPDGVTKLVSIRGEPVWSKPLEASERATLLDEHYRSYHERLTDAARDVLFGIDCHTMASHGPEVGPDPGVRRPLVCIGTGRGGFPRSWASRLARCFEALTDGRVTIDDPFGGGWITRGHGGEMPWIQIELSRDPALSLDAKRDLVEGALGAFVGQLLSTVNG